MKMKEIQGRPYVHVKCKSNQTSIRLDIRQQCLVNARHNVGRFQFPSRRVRRSVEHDAAKNEWVAIRNAEIARQEIISNRDAQPVDSEGLTSPAI